jgi:hypothetical protein
MGVPGGPSDRDAIAVWLDTLGVLLRMPGAKCAAIRDELEGHLRERVRDLLLNGTSEPEAVRTAIGELGDAVMLAERLRAAGRGPRRRHIMASVAIFGVAGAALVTSLVALQGGSGSGSGSTGDAARSPVPAAVFTPTEQPQAKDVRVMVSPEMSFADFAKALSDGAGKSLDARWKLLDGVGAAGDTNLPIENTLKGLPIREAIRMINEGLAPKSDGVDYRIDDDRLIFSTTEYFDKQEVTLVAYDLKDQAAQRARQIENKSIAEVTSQVTEQVCNVIRDLVHPEQWKENGGDRASIAVYGSKLFVRAPKRFHPEIEWVLAQLPGETSPQLAELPIIGGQLQSAMTQEVRDAGLRRPVPDQLTEKQIEEKAVKP